MGLVHHISERVDESLTSVSPIVSGGISLITSM